MYESKVVDMTQRVVSGAPYILACNPSPALLTRLIAEYEEQGWEVVSVNVKPDSGWIFHRNDESTIVTFKREKKAGNAQTNIQHGLTTFAEMWSYGA